MTPPETRLWVRIRRRDDGCPAFRRQHPVGPYILDFFCREAALAVEIDGWAHGVGDQPRHDARRDAWLVARGIDVLRIEAAEVMRDPDDVADGVKRLASARAAGRRS